MTNRLPTHEWESIREEVLERDRHECSECEIGENDAESLHVHHKRPLEDGGSNDIENLRTLCQSCHFEIHADHRRNGSLGDIRDIYRRAEVPAFRTGEIAELIGNLSGQAAPKLKKLVEEGFLESSGDGVYYRSNLPVESAQIANNGDVIVDGSYIEKGEYVGYEDRTLQCGDCGHWVYSRNPKRSLKKHRKYCRG